MTYSKNIIVASGPVIIEEHKVLLCREKKNKGITPWFFPGGKLRNLNETPEQTCIREAKEELGIDVTLIKPLRTTITQRPDDSDHAVLIHYLASRDGDITPASRIHEWGWHDLQHLPTNCAPNVIEIISDLTSQHSNL